MVCTICGRKLTEDEAIIINSGKPVCRNAIKCGMKSYKDRQAELA